MTTVQSYKVRLGGFMATTSSRGATGGGVCFMFGTETQKTDICNTESEVVQAEDACVFGGSVYSAQYKALPGTKNGKLVFNASVSYPPVLSEKYDSGTGGSSGGNSPIG